MNGFAEWFLFLFSITMELSIRTQHYVEPSVLCHRWCLLLKIVNWHAVHTVWQRLIVLLHDDWWCNFLFGDGLTEPWIWCNSVWLKVCVVARQYVFTNTSGTSCIVMVHLKALTDSFEALIGNCWFVLNGTLHLLKKFCK